MPSPALMVLAIACGAEPGERDGAADLARSEDEVPVGWASMATQEAPGTTGGRGGDRVEVTTRDELQSSVSGSEPRIVRVTESFNAARVEMGSNKTLEGAPGVELQINLRIGDQQNVIVRDIALRGYGCAPDDPDCSSGLDVVEVRRSHHVWFHHVAISDGSDGNLDIVQGSDHVTVSWTRFSYSTADRGHRFSNLIGSSDDEPADVGRLNVTFHHNWWAENVDQRMPRTRRGRIHVYNNLYTSEGNRYCTNAGFEASLLVENNVYRGVSRPLAQGDGGDMLARGNLFIDTDGDEPVEGQGFDPPYGVEIDAAASIEQRIRAAAGPRP